MELSETDERILLENILDVARLDEEVRGLLAHFQTASDEELAELKQQIKAIESLRAQYRANLDYFGKR
ncbi:MAG: hypothetical protein EP297_05555 [Gammaproteobacteria bacterium]|nr:MAG: hypothetical protein EP297_05555 [Gammaproteobacteria bacterium]